MLKFNKNMEEDYKKVIVKHNYELSKNLNVIWPEFREVEGCILINKNNEGENFKLNIDNILSLHYDRTGFEASYNELRIEDYFNEFLENTNESLVFGVKLSEMWECKLKKDYPTYKFHIIISYDGRYTTIRFHKYREDEGSWIELDNLDGYEDESIAIRIIS